MEVERKLVEFFSESSYGDLSDEAIIIGKQILLTICGTIIAGTHEQGVDGLINLFSSFAGKKEATILMHGAKIDAGNAALINGYMARAVDYCDALSPGMHIGASTVPAGFAAAELKGGCTGKDFLTSLVLGAELAIRLNLSESAYDGFDPTGVCTVFASTLIAGRILRLDTEQMWDALALAFNQSGGSFQSNVDASLAVRCIQGWVARSGIECVRFAKAGITGPKNFLEGVYGYFHLFGKDTVDPPSVIERLGEESGLSRMVFKKYPSCALTQAATDTGLNWVVDENLQPDDVERIDVVVPSYAYRLVGHPFRIGENPRVNAQFSIQYCMASALLKKEATLKRFEEKAVKDPEIISFTEKIHVSADSKMDAGRGHTALDARITLKNGQTFLREVDIAPGFPGNPLTPMDHERHFQDCVAFAKDPFPESRTKEIFHLVQEVEHLKDVSSLIQLLSYQTSNGGC